MIVGILFLQISTVAQKLPKQDFSVSEDAYRANNRGVGLLEQYKFEEAEKEFWFALSLKPTLKLAKINLVIALFNSKKLAETKTLAREYLKIENNSPQAYYILGLTARSENQTEEALQYFQKVLSFDSKDVGANVNAGQILAQKREYQPAIKYFQIAFEAQPFNLTAIYNLATSLQRNGEREKSAELLKKFQILRDTSAGTNIGLNYLEQGHYAEAVSSNGTESEFILPTNPAVNFGEATTYFFSQTKTIKPHIRPPRKKAKTIDDSSAQVPNFKSNIAALFDYDTDGRLDLVISKGGALRLYHNVKGKFVDVTAISGDLGKDDKHFTSSLVAGDYDNDLKPDLLAVRSDGISLFRNEGNGKFTEVTRSAGLRVQILVDQTIFLSGSSAWVDYDHDGDLDIFVAGGLDRGGKNETKLSNQLFRNNNNGTFTDVSELAKIGDKPNGGIVVPTDFNNSRDVDLLLVGKDKTYLYSNQRNDTFKEVAIEAGITQGGNCVAAADVNKDGFTDYFIGREDGENGFFLNEGNGKFKKQKISNEKFAALHSQFLDYDNDGLIDLITSTKTETRVWRNIGKDWQEINKKERLKIGGSFISGDIDNDGDLDLVFTPPNEPIKIFRNNGGNINQAENLSLQGRVSNKSGIGAKILLRSGSLAQQLESYSASPMPAPSEIHFGLGKREKADSIRILWSSGIVQTETDFSTLSTGKNNSALKITEIDRKPASCPYLYSWDGEKFVFITDFLGGGEMGGWAGKGSYHYPDSDEIVLIPPDQLKAKNGFYEIRVTNELEEVMYLDKVKLVAVEHDANTEIYPNEGLGQSEKSSDSIISTSNSHPPISATNSNGENIVSKIKALDRIFYDDFKNQEIRGYADTHNLTLNLDDKKGYRGRTTLLLTGWTDYAFSSDNVRASQSGRSLFFPYLQVKNKQGEWQTVIESIGIPIGRPQTLTVDLTGKFLTDSREVRIVSNFRTYWDKIAVDTSPKERDLKTTEIEPDVAKLQEHGFGKETKFNGMIVPDYNKASFDSPWKDFAGRFTKFGDVRSLLKEIDDTFVIAKSGDEFVLSFKELPAPAKGKTYTFLLFADGYSKEMDINSASPDAVFPLPFKGMKKYPYGEDEVFPMTEERRKIYDQTLTRFSRGGLAKY